jgi:hypothetical protein
MKRTKSPLIKPEVFQAKLTHKGNSNPSWDNPPIYEGKYHPSMVKKAEKLIGMLGSRVDELAVYFDVCMATINEWRSKYPEFDLAIKTGKMKAAEKVSRSLYKRAVGFHAEDTQFFMFQGQIISETYEKYYPPDSSAAVKWLQLVQRGIWAENIKVDINHQISGTVNFRKVEEIPVSELNKAQQELLFSINMKQLSEPQKN